MKNMTFKIRYRIMQAFLFSVVGVIVFAILSFQVHREIGRRLVQVELDR